MLAQRGSALVRVGGVGGLGVGERIQSVRFLGPTAHVVTFRRTDPLCTVDLSDAANPRVTGALKITGYSAYLHPVADGRLLGVGQEATDEGRATGTQVSLFDTTGAEARPIARYHRREGLPRSSSTRTRSCTGPNAAWSWCRSTRAAVRAKAARWCCG
ncbi:Beta propeller domain-containing protein [Actinokineospora iranica]|uniref:Beta propeller domain-containing protein n=1 Tax=Actinokineospora iranica TaxID=1271860 RepID=A0A1G6JEQ4_9PSEU|nr:Beta propeller domain-containing protein [Actinokineospora iranica]